MSRIMQVFYGNDCLPYKDKERQVHYPVIGNSFAGSSRYDQINFYVGDIGGANALSWVAIVKLPNGKILYQLLSNQEYDDVVGEYYLTFDISSYYTQAKGDLYISLNGCQGQVTITTDDETDISTISGEIDSRTVVATGAVKLSIYYAPQRPIGYSFELDQYQTIIDALGNKANVINTIQIVADISQEDLSSYATGQLFYSLADHLYYKKVATSPYYELADKGILGESKVLYRVSIDSSTTIEDLASLTDNYTRLLVAKYQSQDYLLGISKIGSIYALVVIMFNYGYNDPLVIFKGSTTDNTETIASFITNNNKVVYVKQTNIDERVYGTDELGNQTTYEVDSDLDGSGAIVRRESGTGTVVVGTPTSNTHATTKRYVDDGLTTKLDKVTTSTGYDQVYVRDVNGNQTTINAVADNSNASSIVKRRSNGFIYAGNIGANFGANDAVNKYYVDSKIATITSALVYKGTKTVAQINALTDNSIGDVYNVSDSGTLTDGSVSVNAGDNVAWDGSKWDKLSSDVDLSGYATKEDLPNDVLSNQATTTLITNPTTNANGWLLSNYASADVTIVPDPNHPEISYDCVKITRGGNNLTEAQAITYMEAMTGSKFLPKYNFQKPSMSLFIDKDGNAYKPQWDSTNGLLLYKLGTLGGGSGAGVIEKTGAELEDMTYTKGQLYYCTSASESFSADTLYMATGENTIVRFTQTTVNTNPAITAFSVSPTTTELGNTRNCTYSYTLKKYSALSNLSLDGTVIAATPSSASGSGTAATAYDSHTFTLSATYNGGTLSKTASISPLYRQFYGVVSGDTVAQVLANLKDIQTDTSSLKTLLQNNLPSSVSLSLGSTPVYVYFIVRSNLTINTLKSGGFDVPFSLVDTQSFTNHYNASYTVKVYRTDNKVFGDMVVNINS